jgi:hypothetical protein
MSDKAGRRPIRYGERTFQGWADYYSFWGVRKPSKRTICSHYAECRKRGMSEEKIIAAQKRLWLKGRTKLMGRPKLKTASAKDEDA